MRIKELCEADRPREKMLKYGADSLGNAELIAILLRSGSKTASALELANQLLKLSQERLSGLSSFPVERLCSISGIGEQKACSLLAAFELGRRFMTEEATMVKKPIVTADMVYELMIPKLKGLCHEECWILLLNDHNYVIAIQKLSSGGGRATVIDSRHVIKAAILNNASSVILVHNHPSGNPTPSRADIHQTEELNKALKACNLALLDHVVIADGSFYSFSDEKETCVKSFFA